MNANCDAPVNTSIDITQAWAQLRPAATASTPKETPYTPTAIPIPAAPDSVRSRDRSRHAATVVRVGRQMFASRARNGRSAA